MNWAQQLKQCTTHCGETPKWALPCAGNNVLLICRQYSEERNLMMAGLRKMEMVEGDEKGILSWMESSGWKKEVFKFLTSTGRAKSILWWLISEIEDHKMAVMQQLGCQLPLKKWRRKRRRRRSRRRMRSPDEQSRDVNYSPCPEMLAVRTLKPKGAVVPSVTHSLIKFYLYLY